MPLPEKRDHKISLAEATDLTKKHRKDHPQEGHGGFFHREAFETLLKQPGCAGIRIYHGKGKGGEKHLVLVGVDQDGADIASGDVMQRDWPCPPYCDRASPFNS